MKISTIQELLGATVLTGADRLGDHVYSACGSDLMSDVLAYVKDQAVLLTGLVNTQVVRIVWWPGIIIAVAGGLLVSWMAVAVQSRMAAAEKPVKHIKDNE